MGRGSLPNSSFHSFFSLPPMRFTILSVLSAISTFFLARAAPVDEHSALPLVARSTNGPADVFEEIQFPPRQAANSSSVPQGEAGGLRETNTSGCVVA
ncbi:hypothetical protein C8R46DRAFT_1088575 [Mycena filopes]|nr:hypothetical protein C8R46DRAFT_1088575 [Mycena filopes]